MRQPFGKGGGNEAGRGGARSRRRAVAAVEAAVCLPIVVLFMLGLWEVGRIVEVSNVMWNGAREAARDASVGQDDLQTVATNLVNYLQGAEPTAFRQGDGWTLQAPTIPLPANTTGWTCWDTTANVELFTITFTDFTAPAVNDPTSMTKLDHYQIAVSVPYSTVGWTALAQVTGETRLSVAVDWACMKDSPYTINAYLPAQ
jgi:Flp pilus assembly protein TadG